VPGTPPGGLLTQHRERLPPSPRASTAAPGWDVKMARRLPISPVLPSPPFLCRPDAQSETVGARRRQVGHSEPDL
jgi:hypothetical protein